MQKELESSLDALERQSNVVVGDNRLCNKESRSPICHRIPSQMVNELIKVDLC